MTTPLDRTIYYRRPEEESQAKRVLKAVFEALQAKGYNPVAQISGYLISGDPAYITNHNDARNLIRTIERDDLIEELLRSYIREEL
jgi:uncharacterized protein (UPF0297 family)